MKNTNSMFNSEEFLQQEIIGKTGYCPLIKKTVDFAINKQNAVICYEGGGIGETCEHMIVIPKDRLKAFMNMSERKISKFYGMIVDDNNVKKG